MAKEKAQKKPIFKRWWFWLVVVLLVAGAASSIAGGDQGEGDVPAPPSEADTETVVPAENSPMIVELSADVGGEEGKPEFTIKTNLPDETELMLTLSDGAGFTAQTKVVIEGGTATSDAFSDHGEPLAGAYSLSVSMGLPRLQSDAVRSVIGEAGENITGPYVEPAEIAEGNVVSAEFEFEF